MRNTVQPKTLTRKDIFTPVFIAALPVIAKTWKQFRWPSIDEWIKKIHTHIWTSVLCINLNVYINIHRGILFNKEN